MSTTEPDEYGTLDTEIKKLRSSVEALGATITLRDSRCERHSELLKEQSRINHRLEQQLMKVQDNNNAVIHIVEQNKEAIQTLAAALDRSEHLQNERHAKTLEVQQKNLEANVSLLKIFQDHQGQAEQTFSEIEKKIVINGISYKAFMGLGLGVVFMVTLFFSTLITPRLDSIMHFLANTVLGAVQ